MKKDKTKFFASPFIMFGLIFILILGFAMWALVFIIFLKGGNNATTKEDMQSVLITVSIVVLLMLFAFSITCQKGFSVFEISEKGVKRSLFKVFKKVEITWNEMYEIRCYGMVSIWLFFSKTSLEGMSYNSIIKRKDVLQIEYNKEIVELIKKYTTKEIINLPTKS